MRTDARLALVLAVAAALAACNNELCIRHSDCDPGLVCSASGACLAPAGPDAGDVDASIDAAIDAPPDAPVDAAVDAPPDASVDAAIDAVPAVLDLPSATDPIVPDFGLPSDLTTFHGGSR